MKRDLQGHYITISTVGEEAQAFVPDPLPPNPPIDWVPDLRSRFDQALLALGRLDSISTFLPDISLFLYMLVEKTGITPATVNKCLRHLERLAIVRELTSRSRNRVFSYAGILEIMNQGTELPG
jgi:Fic family protein